MAEAKAIGKLVKDGWRPRRTLVYASWDGEEPGLLGSTEWAEQHAAELKTKAVLYVNSDTNGRGFLAGRRQPCPAAFLERSGARCKGSGNRRQRVGARVGRKARRELRIGTRGRIARRGSSTATCSWARWVRVRITRRSCSTWA